MPVKNPQRTEVADRLLRGHGLDVDSLIASGDLETTDVPDQPHLYVDRDQVHALVAQQRALGRMGAFSSPAGATVAAPVPDDTAAEISRLAGYSRLGPDKKKAPASSTPAPATTASTSVTPAQAADIARLVSLSSLKPADAR